MGMCTCVKKNVDIANKSIINLGELLQQNNIQIKKYTKEETGQTNAFDSNNGKSQNKTSTISQKSDVMVQNFVVKKITFSKTKDKNVINIVILGASCVGKSAFLIKITKNIFEKMYIPTICRETKTKTISYNTHNYKLIFTDTATNDYKEDYSEIYEKADFFIVIYDVTNYQSFTEAKNIINNEISKNVAVYGNNISNVFLVGNKNDIVEKNIQMNEINDYCSKHKFNSFDISVKTSHNINSMLQEIVKTYVKLSLCVYI